MESRTSLSGALVAWMVACLVSLAGCGGGSSSQSQAQAPSSATGGQSTSSAPVVTNSAIPAIQSFYPACARVGGADFTVYVSGQNFTAASVVRWNGVERPTTYERPTNLQARIPASDIAAAGSAEISVFTPAPGGGVSSSRTFTTATAPNPVSIAVDPSGQFVYVVNRGCAYTFPGNVSMFRINASSGILNPIAAPVDAGFGANAIAVHPSGSFVYVTHDDDFDIPGGGATMYSLDPTSGALATLGAVSAPCARPPSPGSCAPESIAIHPNGLFAYVANEGGYSPTSISMYSIDTSMGYLDFKGLLTAAGRAVGVTVNAAGTFAYVTLTEQNRLSVYSIDASTGAWTPAGFVDTGDTPRLFVLHPNGSFAYLRTGPDGISTYRVDATTGKLTQTGSMAASQNSVALKVHPGGRFAYVANAVLNTVSTYRIDVTTGNLTLIGATATGTGPSSIAVDPAGRYAYVANTDSNNVSMYSVDAVTGVLTLLATIGT